MPPAGRIDRLQRMAAADGLNARIAALMETGAAPEPMEAMDLAEERYACGEITTAVP